MAQFGLMAPIDGCRPRRREAEQIGISTVYQEVNLLPDLSVTENICLGREPRKFGFIDWKAAKERARKALAKLEVDIDVSANLASYSIAIQQLVAIARSLDVECKLLILDEPTSSLDENETHQLFQIMRHLRDQGLAIIFITHFLDQVLRFAQDHQPRGRLQSRTFVPTCPGRNGFKMIGKSAEKSTRWASDFQVPNRLWVVILKAKENLESGVVRLNFELHAGPRSAAGLLGSGALKPQPSSESHPMTRGIWKSTEKSPTKDWPEPQKAVRCDWAPHRRQKTHRSHTGCTVRENIILAAVSKGALNQIPRRQQDQIAKRHQDSTSKRLRRTTPKTSRKPAKSTDRKMARHKTRTDHPR